MVYFEVMLLLGYLAKELKSERVKELKDYWVIGLLGYMKHRSKCL